LHYIPSILEQKVQPSSPPIFLVAFMAGKFVISPEQFVEKCRSLANAKDLHVEVKDGQIRLVDGLL
jgi:hypothetical protein